MQENFNLNEASKRNPFKTPENYFEELPDNIFDKCHKRKPTTTQITNGTRQILYYAASVVLALTLTFALNHYSDNKKSDIVLAQNLSSDDMDLLTTLYDIDADFIAEYITELDKSETAFADENAIVEYLTDNTDNDMEFYELFEY